MMDMTAMYEQFGISRNVLDFGREIEEQLQSRLQEIDRTAEYNQMKVLKAMQDNRVSDVHFAATTGYGYNDLGRDTLEEVYASAFHGESALVRPQLISGTHALHVALSGNLRPGDELLSPAGNLYSLDFTIFYHGLQQEIFTFSGIFIKIFLFILRSALRHRFERRFLPVRASSGRKSRSLEWGH